MSRRSRCECLRHKREAKAPRQVSYITLKTIPKLSWIEKQAAIHPFRVFVLMIFLAAAFVYCVYVFVA